MKCWKGYKKKGTKIKNGKRVNNCVKESTGPKSLAQFMIESEIATNK